MPGSESRSEFLVRPKLGFMYPHFLKSEKNSGFYIFCRGSNANEWRTTGEGTCCLQNGRLEQCMISLVERKGYLLSDQRENKNTMLVVYWSSVFYRKQFCKLEAVEAVKYRIYSFIQGTYNFNAQSHFTTMQQRMMILIVPSIDYSPILVFFIQDKLKTSCQTWPLNSLADAILLYHGLSETRALSSCFVTISLTKMDRKPAFLRETENPHLVCEEKRQGKGGFSSMARKSESDLPHCICVFLEIKESPLWPFSGW